MTKDEAIEWLSAMRDRNDYQRKEALDMAIEALKQNQWIPCSERLPKKDEEVLVYLFGDSPYIAWHDGCDWCTEDFTVDKDDEPFAWMPLPKAYEGRTE